MQLFVNNWYDTLTADAGLGAATISISPTQAAKLKGITEADYYLLTLVEVDGSGVEIDWEVVKVTGVTSGVLNVERAQDDTVARDWLSGTSVEVRLTAGAVDGFSRLNGWPHDVPTLLGSESLPTVSAAFSSETLTGNDLEGINVYRFTPERDIEVSALAYSINVTSGATSGDTIAAVIYQSGADGWPSDVLAQSSPEPLDAGIKKGASIGTAVTLKAGRSYWIGLHSSMENGAASATVASVVGHFAPMQWHLSAGYNFSTIWLDTLDAPGSADSWPSPFDYSEHGSALGPVPVVGLITA